MAFLRHFILCVFSRALGAHSGGEFRQNFDIEAMAQ
jgi:hypothetical protein